MKNVPVSELVIRHLHDADRGRWDSFVDETGVGTFFHRAGWRRVIESAIGHSSFYLMAERDGRVVGVLPLVHVRSRIFGSALISTAFCVQGGPLAEDASVRNALVEEAVGLAENVNADYLELRCAYPEQAGWQSRSNLYVLFRREIDRDIDRAMLAIPRKQRAMIRKGAKLGLRSEIDDRVDRFYEVFATSQRNLGTPVLSKRYFQILKDVFADDCQIVTVLDRDGPVSAVLSFYSRGTVLPYYGGGTARARALAANDFMYWEVMRYAHLQGASWFDFGRSKVNSGSFAFKKNWGFEPKPLVYSYYLRGGSTLPDINPMNPKYRAFIWMWKRLPLSLSKVIGPPIARGIG